MCRVSIIICTCNRAEYLRGTLEAMGHLDPGLPTELLIVDNGSTDHTAELAKNWSMPNMALRYVYEPRRGKGYAYNYGMACAQGTVFLFTDDDVRPPENWIANMCQPIFNGAADAVAGGVKFAPHLERPWLTPRMRSWLASTEEIESEGRQRMVGANMAFSRRVLERVPAFDPELGPGALGFCDETLFSWQLAAAGFRIVNAFVTAVEHHFDPARLTRQSFIGLSEKMGRSEAYLAYHWEHQQIDARTCRRKVLRMRAGLLKERIKQRAWRSQIPLLWEMSRVRELGYYRQLLLEHGQPRKYERFGLKKKEMDAV